MIEEEIKKELDELEEENERRYKEVRDRIAAIRKLLGIDGEKISEQKEKLDPELVELLTDPERLAIAVNEAAKNIRDATPEEMQEMGYESNEEKKAWVRKRGEER